jgi:hypothetical protein
MNPLLIGALKQVGLKTIGNLISYKGKTVTQHVQEKLGINLENVSNGNAELTPNDIDSLKALQNNPEEMRLLNERVLKEYEMDISLLKSREEELTKRHQADMKSDSWLSKNVRPCAFLLVCVTYLICFSVSLFYALPMAEKLLPELASVLTYFMSFYVGFRTIDKGIQKIK